MTGYGLLGRTRRLVVLVVAMMFVLTWRGPLGAASPSPVARPEDVGVSTERLQRVAELVQRHIAAGSFSGAVTLVARDGRIVYHQAAGLMDLEAKKPMVKDGRRPPPLTAMPPDGKLVPTRLVLDSPATPAVPAPILIL